MTRWNDDYDSFYYLPSKPREVVGGIKARSQRGDFAKNWWAARWLHALERLMDPGRLSRGRRYARRGQVISIQDVARDVMARVQGSRPTPYKVRITLRPLDDIEWECVLDALAAQALFAARLLAGEMPQEIEQVFAASGVSLFPARRDDLMTDCSCPDWANPCKHVAATHYILGEQFDEDPFLLFRLRGRTQEQIMEALRQRRADDEDEPEAATETREEPEDVSHLEETLERFWEMGELLEPFPVHMNAPAVELPVLRRLGEPSFMATGVSLQSQLGAAYRGISETALDVAFRAEPETG